MRSGKEQKLNGSIEHGGCATSHLRVNAGGGDGDEEAHASTSLEHWKAQSVGKAAQPSISAFQEDDDQGLNRTFRFVIIFGFALIMLAIILCLNLVLPHSSHKSPKHDNSSKLLSWKHFHVHTSRQIVIHPTELRLHNQNHRRHSFCRHHVHHKQLVDGDLAISYCDSACNASRFPDICQESLVSDPSTLAATSVVAIIDSVGALSLEETLSLRPLAQPLLSASDIVAWQVADAQAWMSAASGIANSKSVCSKLNRMSARVFVEIGAIEGSIRLLLSTFCKPIRLKATTRRVSSWISPDLAIHQVLDGKLSEPASLKHLVENVQSSSGFNGVVASKESSYWHVFTSSVSSPGIPKNSQPVALQTASPSAPSSTGCQQECLSRGAIEGSGHLPMDLPPGFGGPSGQVFDSSNNAVTPNSVTSLVAQTPSNSLRLDFEGSIPTGFEAVVALASSDQGAEDQ
ncbi:hypothetical protein L7F22_058055 [Adiantum nelumboides]|nr:hypothetical protein [Adiantum nelumboides]